MIVSIKCKANIKCNNNAALLDNEIPFCVSCYRKEISVKQIFNNKFRKGQKYDRKYEK